MVFFIVSYIYEGYVEPGWEEDFDGFSVFFKTV